MGICTLIDKRPEFSTKPVRSIFVSDVHLGCRHAQADSFLRFLNQHHPPKLYLVGDFIDGCRLRRVWHWKPVYNQVLRRVFDLASNGTRVFYTPGNHDDFLRDFLDNFGVIQINDEFIHMSADGRRYLVIHGDQFDTVELRAHWLSLVGSFAYDMLLSSNYWLNAMLGRGKEHPYAFSAKVKHRVKRVVKHVSDYENLLSARARARRCDGMICGHIHMPTIQRREGIVYYNTGDWVENCTALVEFEDGLMQLIQFPHDAEGEVVVLAQEQPKPQLPIWDEPVQPSSKPSKAVASA